jgi:hypothetical protein
VNIRSYLLIIGIIIISAVLFIYIFGFGGIVASIFEVLLIYSVVNPDSVQNILATFYKSSRNVNFWFEKKAVEQRIENTINSTSKKINEECPTLLPHGVDIKWVDPVDRGTFLKEEKVVVCLEQSVNEAKNLARANMLYVSEDLIRDSQKYINPIIMKSLCIATTRKILMMDKRIDALKCFNEEFYETEIQKTPSLKNYVDVMEKLDIEGLFTRLILKEFSELEPKLMPAISDPRAEQETRSFMNVMKNLAEKEKGVDINPNHRGRIIDVTIMLVAREKTIDPTPYIKYAERCWEEEVSRLYVLAQGKNSNLASNIVYILVNKGLYRVENEWKFSITNKREKFNSYVGILSRVIK